MQIWSPTPIASAPPDPPSPVMITIIFVFKLDKYDQIVESKVYNTKDIENIKFTDDKTSNEIVKRGLLEKIFGGVGTQQELPTTP